MSVKSDFIYEKIYNTTRWRKLREAKLMQDPLCQDCLDNHKITAATQVHHVREISSADSPQAALELGFDFANLRSLCQDCHERCHGKKESSLLSFLM